MTQETSVRFVVAHIDPYYGSGNISAKHHLVFVASGTVGVDPDFEGALNSTSLQWSTTKSNNGTADEECPYLCSTLHAWEKQFAKCLPDGLTAYLIATSTLLERRYKGSGASSTATGWKWTSLGNVWSLSEIEVYGTTVWGTLGYSVGNDCQFDYFRDTNHRSSSRANGYWLRTVATNSSTDACLVGNLKQANSLNVGNSSLLPRPCFLLG